MSQGIFFSETDYPAREIRSVYDLENYFNIYRLQGKWKHFLTVDVLPDGVTITVTPGKIKDAQAEIIALFPDQIHRDAECDFIRLGKTQLPVYFEESETEDTHAAPFAFRPLLKDTVLLSSGTDSGTIDSRLFDIPPHDDKQLSITAFFSFKGGVGRTLHLAALCKYMAEHINSDFKNPKILLVDADIEAPGLSWWAYEQLNAPSYSFLDLLADGFSDMEIASENASKRVREMRLELGTPQHACFFLPAFRNTTQLLRPPVLPERLALSTDSPWMVSELLFHLGERLGVSHILVDLRAGLTELSSPLFFDPRIQRTLVTTTSYQSVQGTLLALHELKKFASLFDRSKHDFFGKTRVLTSFIPPVDEAHVRVSDIEEQFEKIAEDFAQEKIIQQPSASGSNNEGEDAILLSNWLIRSEFDQNLLGLGSLKEAILAFDRSSFLPDVCKQLFPFPYAEKKIPDSISASPIQKSEKQDDLKQLYDHTRQLIYAEEQGISSNFLTIEPYRRLAASFASKVPNAAIFGAKGAGKTFFFKALSCLGKWTQFCSACGIIDGENNTRLIPLYWSQNENTEGIQSLIGFHADSLRSATGIIADKTRILENHQDLRATFSSPQKQQSGAWREHWFRFFCRSLDITGPVSGTYEAAFRHRISNFTLPLTFLCDGMEDLFSDWLLTDDPIEPLRILLQDILRDVSIWGGGKFGLLILIRKDIVRRAITQNVEQYFSLYRNFEIKWSKEEALRLAGWLLNTQALQKYRSGESNTDWDTKDFQSMCDALIPLWGAKLGTASSNEAYTAYWVLSAISDFKGIFQARDIIRFLNKASERQINRPIPDDRLISPSVIRSVLKACGEEKVSEIKMEMKNIASDLDKISSAKPTMPLTRETLEQIGIASTAVLEEYGIILREEDNFYLPEIYRQGLGVGLSKGARPKVVTLMKKAWKKAGV